MELPIIKIGNSKGIILSKTLMEKYKLGDKIEMIMKPDHIELKPVRPLREGWDEAFMEMHESGEDRLIAPDVLDDDLFEEWKQE